MIGTILFIAGVCFLGFQLQRNKGKEENAYLKITAKGQVYGTYPLNRDMVIKIGHTNTCEIKGGRVSMTGANCPDKLCLSFQEITRRGGTIVCLPNQVVLEIVTDDREVDGIAN